MVSDAIIVALITLLGTIITVVITSKATQDKVTAELKIQNELQSNELNHVKEKLNEYGNDIKEHNNYARQLPEIQGKLDLITEKVSVANKRIEDLEAFQKDMTSRLMSSSK